MCELYPNSPRSLFYFPFDGYTGPALLLLFTVCSVPVTPSDMILDMRKSFEVEVKTTETTEWRKTIIGVDIRQDETRQLIKPRQIAASSEREGGDDWFIWFEAIREKPVFVPPGVNKLDYSECFFL